MGGYSGPAAGTVDQFTVLTTETARNGFFAATPDREQGDGLFLDVVYEDHEVVVELFRAAAGDANGDRSFNFDDIFQVLAAGRYETGITATWGTGDWNRSTLFDFDDIFEALVTGNYETGPYALTVASAARPVFLGRAIPEPSGATLMVAAGLAGLLLYRRSRRRARWAS
jgi:hypothetical protein